MGGWGAVRADIEEMWLGKFSVYVWCNCTKEL